MPNKDHILIISSDLQIHEKLKNLHEYQSNEIILLLEDLNDAALEHTYTEECILTRDFSDHEALRLIYTNILITKKLSMVIPMDEFSIYVSALIASWASLPAPSLREAQMWRDKITMKNKVSERGIATPRRIQISEVSASTFPIIIKPRSLAGSTGIVKFYDLQEFNRHISVTPLSFDSSSFNDMSDEDYFIDEFIDLPLFNINGIYQEKNIAFWCISEYIGSQLEHFSGRPLASLSVPKNEYLYLEPSIRKILESLEIPDGAFHLELFIEKGAPPLFLEIGARPGGGEIVRTIEAEYSINLNELHFVSKFKNIDLINPIAESTEHAYGWISVPFNLTAKTNVYLKEINFITPQSLEILRIRKSPTGIDIRRPFYSQERSLATIIFRCDKTKSEALTKELLNSIFIEGFDYDAESCS